MTGLGLAQDRSECIECHREATPDVVVAHGRSVRAKQAFHGSTASCVTCHGGDPAAKTAEAGHAAAKGFRGRLSVSEATKQCMTCHSDAVAMKPHGLDTSLVSLWTESVHGKLASSGDARAPSCIECHGSHGVLSHRDEASPTHPSAVASTCAKCHSDAAKMGDSKLPTDQLREYMAGAHGKLLSSADPARRALAPSCADCHGAHGSKPPDAQSVAAVCKNCHFEAARYLSTGGHSSALRHTGSPSCVDCHDNHRTTLGSDISATCNKCHEDDDDPARSVTKQLVDLISGANTRIADLDTLLTNHALSNPTKVALLSAERRRIGELHRKMLSVTHSLRLDDLEAAIDQLDSSIQTVQAISLVDLEESKGFSTPMIIGILISVACVLIVLSIVIAKLLIRLSRAEPRTNG